MTDTAMHSGPVTGRTRDARPSRPPVPPGTATPAYTYDLAAVRSAHARLRSWLPQPSELYYSLKANPHPAVVSTLHGLGCRAEVSSPGELDAALEAGIPGHDILCTGPGKRDEDLDRALGAGVRDFAVDSEYGIGQLDRAAARHGVRVTYLLRVNPGGGSRGAGLRMTGEPSAFGADAEDVAAHPGRYRGGEYARLDGLHLYLATNIADEEALGNSFTEAITVARTLREAFGVLCVPSTSVAASPPPMRAPANCPLTRGSRTAWPANWTRHCPAGGGTHPRWHSSRAAT
ncbi:hypothetical protein [Streptomyces sp. NPDC056683]|uniref:hypothetical protein n=1 Tax=Streptomyces sp. NPDC056683 TaxID=3345910 RepID=UPI003690794E